MMFYRKALFLVALLFCGSMSLADDPANQNALPKEDMFRDVAGDLRCPTCTGLSVLDSDAPFSVQIKSEVKAQLAEGKSREQVLKFFVDRYGPWILRAPPVMGVNALAWILPIAVLILGPLGIWLFVGRKVRKSVEAPVRPAAEIIKEMQSELEVLRSGRLGVRA